MGKPKTSQELDAILTKEFLEEEYLGKNLSVPQIAKKVGCVNSTIDKYIKKRNIITKKEIVNNLLTKEFLYGEYITKNISYVNIARKLNCSDSLIKNKLIEFNMFKPFLLEQKLTKEFLEEEYIHKGKNINQIALETGHSKTIISLKIKENNLPLKYNKKIILFKKLEVLLTKEFLVQEHLNNKKSILEISKEIGCDSGSVVNYLKKHNITIHYWDKERKLSLLTEKFLVLNYPKFSCSDIAKQTGCTFYDVKQGLIRFGIQMVNKGVFTKGKRKKRLIKAKKRGPQSTQWLKNRLKKMQASPNIFEVKCLEYLNKKYLNEFKYTGDGSLVINNYSADAEAPTLKTVAFFHGDYWHCNPKKYKADYYHSQIKKTAQQIWDKDKKAVEAFEKAGYKVIVIWEGDLKNE